MIYAADCHQLKTDQKTDIKIDDYFLWKERSLFDCIIRFSGSNKTNHEYGEVSSPETITTTITYEAALSEVINNNRENKFPELKDDGTFEIKKSSSFNPAGKYGKINDSDLIRIPYNPCFSCSFSAYVTLHKIFKNLVVGRSSTPGIPPPPTAPSEAYYQWQVIRGPTAKNNSGDPQFDFLINAGQSFTVNLTINIHPGYIDPKTRELGNIINFSGWAEPSGAGSNGKIKVGDYQYDASVGVEGGITAQIEWKPSKKRPA